MTNIKSGTIMFNYKWRCISTCAFLWMLPFGSLCEPVWAEPIQSICGWAHASRGEHAMTPLYCDVSWTPGHPRTEPPDPCLATMEAAMRAMDDFMPLEVFTAGVAYGMKMVKQKDVGDWMREAVKLQTQWDGAKRCWKGKP